MLCIAPELLSPQGFTFLIFFVGTIGHVAHGKSTVVKALSGVQVIFFRYRTCVIILKQLKFSAGVGITCMWLTLQVTFEPCN